MISFIVPAHNEELFLPKTLTAIRSAAQALNIPHEIIVVDDSSTDRTNPVARELGARVINVNRRQIAAARNSGARAAVGELLFFVDADTTVTHEAVSSALKRMEKGAIGGGAVTYFEDAVPLYARLLLASFGILTRLASLSGGAFMFCTKRAFEAVGGFDERLYGAEDAAMSAALKKEGRFVMLREGVATSGRRVRSVTGLRVLALMLQIAVLPSHLKNRKNVERVWYVSNRSSETAGDSLPGRLSNFCALIIMLLLISIPIWVVPWPKFLLDGPLGQLKHFCAVVVTHVGLVLWPCSLFLAQKKLAERLKIGLLILVCVAVAFAASLDVLEFWRHILKSLL